MLNPLFLFIVIIVIILIYIKLFYKRSPDLDNLHLRVNLVGNKIFINNDPSVRHTDVEVFPVIKLEGNEPELIILEGNTEIYKYRIEPKKAGISLDGAYLHASVRVNANSSVQIDGILSHDSKKYNKNKDEGIRFQPFFLSDRSEMNERLIGQGSFARGLHYSGIISSGDVRIICVCDECKESFSLSFYHAGFSEIQYFYSTSSKEIIFVRYWDIPNLPLQLQKDVDEKLLAEVESELPVSNDGAFKYYNGLRCPHCEGIYIDFENHKDLRSGEYYAHYYLNTEPQYYSK